MMADPNLLWLWQLISPVFLPVLEWLIILAIALFLIELIEEMEKRRTKA